MAEYRLIDDNGAVIRSIDCATIPNDPANRDRVEYHAWVEAGGVPDPYVAPPTPVPQSISDRQFFQQLAVAGIISQDQALASNAAVIPAPLLAIIDAMPSDQQFAAKMLVSGATVFERNHPMTEAIGGAYGWNGAQIDAFFTAAAAL